MVQQKVEAAQVGKFGGTMVWKCIRDIQRDGRRGLIPMKTAYTLDENGNTWISDGEANVLNITCAIHCPHVLHQSKQSCNSGICFPSLVLTFYKICV